jgi:hypothetical protein
MFVARICFGLAIIAAVATLGAITGTLDAVDRQENGMTLSDTQKLAVQNLSNGSNIAIPAKVMSLAFLAGMISTIVTGFMLICW